MHLKTFTFVSASFSLHLDSVSWYIAKWIVCWFSWFSCNLWVFFPCSGWEEKNLEMELHISPSLRHVTMLPSKGFREFIKVKIGSRRLSYRMVFYSLLFFTFLLRFVFVLTAVDAIEGEIKCSTIGTWTNLFFCSETFHMFMTNAWWTVWPSKEVTGVTINGEAFTLSSNYIVLLPTNSCSSFKLATLLDHW